MNARARNDEAHGTVDDEVQQKTFNSLDTSTANQCAIVLQTLRTGCNSTTELWHDFAMYILRAEGVHHG